MAGLFGGIHINSEELLNSLEKESENGNYSVKPIVYDTTDMILIKILDAIRSLSNEGGII